MMDTARLMLESEFTDETVLNAYGENNTVYGDLMTLSEDHMELMGVTPEKVTVNATKGNNYLVEYTGNLERMMKDQGVESLEEAVEMVAEANEIEKERIFIVVDESCIKKINMKKAKELGFQFLRKN
ncbi:MAG: hypothetical protein PHC62_00805 [Candidatus Izemoplasmatales bacterium]|nr:hypothetical protein [Candidatus Izemoplasmatales bacterium]